MRIDKSILLGLAFLCMAAQGFSQRTSPYSRFGIGNLYVPEFAPQKGMGQISSAYNDEFITNYGNPATYGLKNFTSLDIGIGVNYESVRDQDFTDNIVNGQLAYFAYAFPLSKNKTWGMGFGIQPLSFKDYNVKTDIVNSTFFREYEGDGNTYKTFLGTGVQLGDFLIGIEGDIIFGHLDDNTYNTFTSFNAISSAQSLDQKIRGVAWKAGAQYRTQFDNGLQLSLGSTFVPKAKINNDLTRKEYTFRPSFGENFTVNNRAIIETQFDGEEQTDFKLPGEITAGIYLDKPNKWSIGADVKSQAWSKFEGINDNTPLVAYQNLVDANLGGTFTPNFTNARKFSESFQYRYGIHYTKSYLELDGTNINDYGITLGVGIPNKWNTRNIHERTSYTNLAIDIGQSGTTENNLVKETFVKATIGVNLNDIWFRKRKYD